jgi:hypothetical protein
MASLPVKSVFQCIDAISVINVKKDIHMKLDGGLRKLFRENIPGDWQSIEAESVGRGVPDANYCIRGREGWVEFKQTKGWTIDLRPEQVGWLERRARNGGRVTIAIRQKAKEGSRREARDVLWLIGGSYASLAKIHGLRSSLISTYCIGRYEGGPKHWDWEAIAEALRWMDK